MKNVYFLGDIFVAKVRNTLANVQFGMPLFDGVVHLQYCFCVAIHF